jgi:hypothetical protein
VIGNTLKEIGDNAFNSQYGDTTSALTFTTPTLLNSIGERAFMNFQGILMMEIKDLSENTGEWLRGSGKESDIVISSRIRLARNITGFPFISRANLKQKSNSSV